MSNANSPAAGWYQNGDGLQQWWDGASWGPVAPQLTPSAAATQGSSVSDEELADYRWVTMGTAQDLFGDPAKMDLIDMAIARYPVVQFASDVIPVPGAYVPADCVWGFIPHPGAIPAKAVRGSSIRKRFVAMGDLRGRTFGEITHIVGAPHMTMNLGGINPAQNSSRMWQGGGLGLWSISLTFDRYDVCSGVEGEISL